MPAGPCAFYETSNPVVIDKPATDAVVEWTGNEYVIVWSSNKTLYGGQGWFDIEFAAADRAGNIVARETPYSFYHPEVFGAETAQVLSVASADDGVGVLWCRYEQTASEGELISARLTSEGTAATEPQPVAPCHLQQLAQLVWNGSGFGALWDCSGALCFARLDESGLPIGGIVQIPVDGMIASLYLFWYDDRYGLAWHEFDPALGANRFLTVSNEGVPRGESVLLSDPDTYAQGFFLNRVYNGYTAVWGERGISGSVEDSLLMARLDRDGNVIGELVALEEAPISQVAFNGNEFGVLLAHYTTIDSRVTYSYGFTTLSEGGDWLSEESPLVEPERYAHPVLFDWHTSGFGLFFYAQPEGEEKQLAYQEIHCLR